MFFQFLMIVKLVLYADICFRALSIEFLLIFMQLYVFITFPLISMRLCVLMLFPLTFY